MKKMLMMVAAVMMISTTLGVKPGETFQVNNNSNTLDSVSEFSAFSNGTGTFVETNVSDDEGNYNITLDYNNSTVYEQFELDSFNNWSFQKDEIITNASVLSGGSVNLSLRGDGNSAETVDFEATGNLSDLDFTVQSPVTIVPGESRSVVNGFSVSRDQGFGWYNGSVEGSGNNFNVSDSVNVSIRVFDDIKPSIDEDSFPDLMALQSEEFTVEVSDNLEVANVTGSVFYETTEKVGNETVLVNETLTKMQFSDDNQDNEWIYSFEDSDVERKYFYNVTVTDTSNNTRSLNGSFQVNRLDSISVLESDFKFKDMRPRTDDNPDRSVTRKVFEKTFNRTLDVNLSSFSHRKNNSSMTVGIRRLDDSNLDYLYRDGENQRVTTVSEPGTYVLEVYSDAQGDTYDGELKLTPVPQHKELQNNGVISFSGTVVDPEYPELPESRSIGSFEGNMEFILNDNGVPTGIRFTGETTDIEDCKGVDSWSNCIPGYTLGELPEANEKVEQWRKEAGDAKFWMKIFALIGLGFPFFSVYNRYSMNSFMVTPKVYRKNIGQEVKDLQSIETGLRNNAGRGGF